MSKISSSLFYVVVIAVSALLFMWNPLARTASDYNRDIAVGGTALYGTLRGVNALMSVAKDTDVSVGLSGTNVSRSPGMVLQPVTDTINRTADALFALVVVAGILSVVLIPVSTLASAVLGVSAALLLVADVFRKTIPASVHAGVVAAAAVGATGSIVIPGAYGVAFIVGDKVTAEAWDEASAVLKRIGAAYGEDAAVDLVAEDVDPASAEAPTEQSREPDGGILENGMRVFGSAVDASRTAIGGAVDAASDAFSATTKAIAKNTKIALEAMTLGRDLFKASIQIVVAYAVKLVVIPLILIASAFYVLRSTVRAGAARASSHSSLRLAGDDRE